MKTEFLNARGVSEILQQLIVEHEEFHWAVAWGSMADAAKVLMKHRAKFRNVTFGVAFSHTDPNLIDKLQGVKGARVVTKFAGGTFHPKIYGFRSGKRAAAIIGSANFTFGGLCKNLEAAVFLTGSASDPFFVELFKFTSASAKLGEKVTPEFATAYRTSFNRAARMKKPPHDPLEGLEKIKPSSFSSELVAMDWSDYVNEVKKSSFHNVEESLKLLRIAQKWFASTKSFADLSVERRKAIAGIIDSAVIDIARRNTDSNNFAFMVDCDV